LPPSSPKPVRIGLNKSAVAQCRTADDLMRLLRTDAADHEVVRPPKTDLPPNDGNVTILPPSSPKPVRVGLNEDDIAKCMTSDDLLRLLKDDVDQIVVQPPKELVRAPLSPQAVKTILDKESVKNCSSVEDLYNVLRHSTVSVKPPKHPSVNRVAFSIGRKGSEGGTPVPEGPRPAIHKDTILDCATIDELRSALAKNKEDGEDEKSSIGQCDDKRTFGRSKLPGAEVQLLRQKQHSFARTKVPGSEVVSSKIPQKQRDAFTKTKYSAPVANAKPKRKEVFSRTKYA